MVKRLMQNMQGRLQQLYELQVPYDVNQFLVTDPVLANRLDQSIRKRSTIEKLLIQQQGDNIDIALFVDRKVVTALVKNDPEIKLDQHNLEHYLVTLEGVSHFIYLVWNAFYDRGVSLFELELQAEVDKFVASVLLLNCQQSKSLLKELYQRIFNNVSYDPALSEEERNRYQSANYYAAKYCQNLISLYLSSPRKVGYVNELRRFYRLTQKSKLNHIALMR